MSAVLVKGDLPFGHDGQHLVRAGYKEITGTMQTALDRLAAQRRHSIVG